MDQATSVSLIVAAGAISGIVSSYVGYSRGTKKDCVSDGVAKGTQEADTAYIKRRVDDILLEQKDTNKSIYALTERVTRCEESSKSAHKRLDLIDEKGQGHVTSI